MTVQTCDRVPARRPWRKAATALGLSAMLLPSAALAHDISQMAQQTMLQGGLLEAVWLGAEHMLTGWDHLLFLLGVLFFLTSFGQIVRFITAFTIGHTITLLGATWLGITANAYLIDALIALTVCYKAAENLGLFRKVFGIDAPNLLYMVFLFGLIHGFGLSTRLQQMTLVDDPDLLPKILAFNVGVELGQIAALALMIWVVRLWRQTTVWVPVMRASNAVLLVVGLGLCAVQVAGFMQDRRNEPALALQTSLQPVEANL